MMKKGGNKEGRVARHYHETCFSLIFIFRDRVFINSIVLNHGSHHSIIMLDATTMLVYALRINVGKKNV